MAARLNDIAAARRKKGSFIDPGADIHPGAVLGRDCTVGPFAVIGEGVRLGDRSIVHTHAVMEGSTVMGNDNEVFPFACIGGAPQDLRHNGEITRLQIGDGNIFREHVTVSRGTAHGGGVTEIGNSNMLMAYCHVAHDCKLGDNIVMANHATLAGHVEVRDHAVFGGMAAVGTFLRIGESAMLAAGAMAERDVPSFCIVAGDRAKLRAVNRVGLDRRGFSKESRRQIKRIFIALKQTSHSIEAIVAELRDEPSLTAEAERMLVFLQKAERGVIR